MVYLQLKQENLLHIAKTNPFIFLKKEKVATFVYTNIYHYAKQGPEKITSMLFDVALIRGRPVHHAIISNLNSQPSASLTTKIIANVTYPYGRGNIIFIHPHTNPNLFHSVNYKHSTYDQYKAQLALEWYKTYLFSQHGILNTNLITKGISPENLTGSFKDRTVSTIINSKLASINTRSYLEIIPVTPKIMYNSPLFSDQEILDKQRHILKQKFEDSGLVLSYEQLYTNPFLYKNIVLQYVQQKEQTELIRKVDFIYNKNSPNDDGDFN